MKKNPSNYGKKYFLLALALCMSIGFANLALAKNVNEIQVQAAACTDNTPDSVSYFVDLKTYAEGAVRVFHVDTDGEPACCSSRVLVFLPAEEGPGSMCFEVSQKDDGRLGFMGLNLAGMVSSYNSKDGLKLSLPVSVYNHEDYAKPFKKNITIKVNQANRSVTAE